MIYTDTKTVKHTQSSRPHPPTAHCRPSTCAHTPTHRPQPPSLTSHYRQWQGVVTRPLPTAKQTKHSHDHKQSNIHTKFTKQAGSGHQTQQPPRFNTNWSCSERIVTQSTNLLLPSTGFIAPPPRLQSFAITSFDSSSIWLLIFGSSGLLP